MSMSPQQFASIRKKFYPNDPVSFMMELGYHGNRSTLAARARRFESGELPVPRSVARYVWLLDQWSLIAQELNQERGAPDAAGSADLPDWPETF